MILAIYPRKSKKRDESESMQMQVDQCREYITRKFPDANIVVYGNDYGITGHSTKKRHDFNRMMDDARSHKIDAVVIYKYDRISRNMYDFVCLFHDLEEVGCSLISVTQDIDTTTPAGRLMMYQLAAFAEHEWQMTSQRYRDTFAYMNKAGINHLNKNQLPLGYKPDKDKRIVVKDETESEMVEFIINDYLDYGTQYHTINALNDKFGTTYSTQTVKTVLFGDICRGKYRENDSFCEPYIDRATAKKIDAIRGKFVRHSPDVNMEYIFNGLIPCPCCGNKLSSARTSPSPTTGKRYSYYRCLNHYKHARCTHNKNTSEGKTEAWLLDNIEPMLNNYVVTANSRIKKPQRNNDIAKYKSEMERLTNAFVKGRIPEEDYDAKYEALKAKVDELTIIDIQEPIQVRETQSMLKSGWREAYSSLTNSNKRLFWSRIIKEIIIDENGKATDVIFL